MHGVSPLTGAWNPQHDLAPHPQSRQGQAQISDQTTQFLEMRIIDALDADAAPAATHATAPQRLQPLLQFRIFPVEGEDQLLQSIHRRQSP